MTYFDSQTDTVYFAEALVNKYRSVFAEAATFLTENNVEVKLIENTENIWCRDYMPIQVGNHFVKFKYADFHPTKRKRPKLSCYKEFDPIISNIMLDGGNVVRYGEKAIVTEKVMRDNPSLKITKLEKLLEAEVILIPVEPYDKLGHSDGVVNFVLTNTIITNAYNHWNNYAKKLAKVLKGNCIKIVPMGIYINFLLVKDVILLPKSNILTDDIALTKIKELYPSFKVKQIDCSKLAKEGGAIHCVSWNIKNRRFYTCR